MDHSDYLAAVAFDGCRGPCLVLDTDAQALALCLPDKAPEVLSGISGGAEALAEAGLDLAEGRGIEETALRFLILGRAAREPGTREAIRRVLCLDPLLPDPRFADTAKWPADALARGQALLHRSSGCPVQVQLLAEDGAGAPVALVLAKEGQTLQELENAGFTAPIFLSGEPLRLQFGQKLLEKQLPLDNCLIEAGCTLQEGRPAVVLRRATDHRTICMIQEESV